MPNKAINEAQKAVINEVEALKVQLAPATETEFHQRYLSAYMSYTVWHRLRHFKYSGDIEKQVNNLRKAITVINEMRALRAAPDLGSEEDAAEFHELPIFHALFEAVSIANNRTDEKRLVIYLAPTGCGKSAFAARLQARYNATYCEASEPWRTSYYAAVKDLCRAVGMGGPWHSSDSAQAELVAEMNKSKGVLVIDEGNTFGKHTCNLVKLILNRTRWTVVINAIPILFQFMARKSWEETQQLLRRCVAVIRHTDITAQTAMTFFKASGFDLSVSQAVHIAAAANKFGGYDMIKDVRAEILSDFPPGEPLKTEALNYAVEASLALKGLTSITPKKGK